MLGDPVWSTAELARQIAYNGTASGWCLMCARKLGRDTLPTLTAAITAPAVRPLEPTLDLLAGTTDAKEQPRVSATGMWRWLMTGIFGRYEA